MKTQTGKNGTSARLQKRYDKNHWTFTNKQKNCAKFHGKKNELVLDKTVKNRNRPMYTGVGDIYVWAITGFAVVPPEKREKTFQLYKSVFWTVWTAQKSTVLQSTAHWLVSKYLNLFQTLSLRFGHFEPCVGHEQSEQNGENDKGVFLDSGLEKTQHNQSINPPINPSINQSTKQLHAITFNLNKRKSESHDQVAYK